MDVQATNDLVNRLAAERVQALFRDSHDIVGIIGTNHVVEYVSHSVTSVLGYQPNQIEGIPVDQLGPGIGDSTDSEVARVLANGFGSVSTFVNRAYHADNWWRWLEVHLTNLVHVPAVQGVVFNAHDITKYKNSEHQLERLAYFDTPTALPNRMNFRQALDDAMSEAARDNSRVAVIFLDLDRFKMINDQFGHDAGDNCLVAVGQRILDSLDDGQIVARLGGDEFAVLARNITHHEVLLLADRVLSEISRPFPSDYRFFNVDASAGIAVRSELLATPSDLLRAADIALYHGKVAHGGGVATMFEPGMSEMTFHRAGMERALQSALDNHEFVPYFQPEINLGTGQLHSLELLMRWRRRDGSVQSPDAFLEIAREMGIIIPMTLDILEQACRHLTEWNGTHRTHQPLRLSFNVTMREIFQLQYPQRVLEILERSGCDPSLVSMEIDDRILHETTPELDRFIQALRRLGISLVVDGYSGGHTSLAYLQRIRPDRIKFSRAAGDPEPSPAADEAILRVVTTVAGERGIPVTMVGPATGELLALAQAAGCQFAQSDYLAAAMPGDDIPPKIAAGFEVPMQAILEMPAG